MSGAPDDIEFTADSLFSIDPFRVRAASKADGEMRWELEYVRDLGWEGTPSPELAHSDDLLYVNDEELVALTPDEGEVAWRYGAEFDSLQMGDVIDGVAYLASTEGMVAVSEGAEVWRAGEGEYGLLSVDSDVVARRGANGVVSAFETDSGDEVWTSEPIAPGRNVDTTARADMQYVQVDGRWYALDRSDGAIRWEYPSASDAIRIESSPEQVPEAVYVASVGDQLVRLDRDGDVTWSASVPGEFAFDPILVDESVIVGTNGGVYALDRSVHLE